MTTAQFSAYNAIVFPDPKCTMPEGSPLVTANATKAAWSPAVIDGRMVLLGTDPVYHADPSVFPINDPGAPPERKAAPSTLMRNAINFAASGTGTGMYMALSCYYEPGAGPKSVTPLSAFGDFMVDGPEATVIHVLAATHPVMSGLTDLAMSGWSSSMHEWFVSYPDGWTALAEETSGPASRPYILAKP
jgi:hypothetical protein